MMGRRIREESVFWVVLPCTANLEEIRQCAPVGIILSGGPSSVYDADAPPADEAVLALGLPELGICSGLHFITHKLGGRLVPGKRREYGQAQVEGARPSRLFAGVEQTLSVWMSPRGAALEL